MSWQDRPYNRDEDFSANNPGGMGRGPRGEARSWLGGMPSPGKAVKYLLIANVAMFVLCKLTGGEDGVLFQSLAMYVGDVVRRFQIWRILTFSYLHDQQSLFHLIFNMIGLYFLGIMLERRWGALKFFLFYTVGSLVGVTLYILLTVIGWFPSSFAGIPISLVGASGGVLALMGACAVLFPSINLILVVFPVPIRLACVIFVVLYAFNLVQRGANAGGDACHLAGLAFGVYIGYRGERWFSLLDRWRDGRSRRQWESERRDALRLEETVDAILEKVRQKGIQGLTKSEKRTLEDATRAKQQTARRPN